MYKVTKVIDFCYGHRLLNYQGDCSRLHGHNGVLEIDVASGKLNELGMVVDFSLISEQVKSWVVENLDHKMILNVADPVVDLLRQANEPFFMVQNNPTAENIAHLVYGVARERGLDVTEVRLWETPTGCATYRGED